MLACPPHRGETSATLQGIGPRRRQPITPNTTKGDARWVMGHMWTHPPSHAITKQEIRCQSKERASQLTRTDPSQTVRPRQSNTPAEPERNHKGQAEPEAGPGRSRTVSRQGAEPAAAAEVAEQGNAERQAGTSDGSAASGGPPRTIHRTEQA